ncbi:MAG: SlyX family protein, partial [Sphaerochaetaceae bacterium]
NKSSKNSTMDETLIDKLEMKLAYMEQTITELNMAVISQNKELGVLQNQVDKLQQKVLELMEDESDSRPSQKPPHY